MFKISLKSVTFIGLSVLAITSEAFRPIHQRFNAQKFASSKNLVKMNSNPNPTTDQANWKQSMSNMINTGVATATLLGLTTVAFAEGTEAVAGGEGLTTTDSGLKYRDTKIGEGALPEKGNSVRVHYTGWLDDFESEKKFDSSYDRRSPLVFTVGVKQVIAGWDEALLTNMKVGGKRDIVVPPGLGYGARGAGGVIPANATLYFKIELVGIGAKKKGESQ